MTNKHGEKYSLTNMEKPPKIHCIHNHSTQSQRAREWKCTFVRFFFLYQMNSHSPNVRGTSICFRKTVTSSGTAVKLGLPGVPLCYVHHYLVVVKGQTAELNGDITGTTTPASFVVCNHCHSTWCGIFLPCTIWPG